MLQSVNPGGENVLQVFEGAPMGGDGKALLVRFGHNSIKDFGGYRLKAAPRPTSLLNHLDEVCSIFAAGELLHCSAGFFRGAWKSH